MKELLNHITATLHGMWHKRWYGVLAAWIIGALAAVVVARIPDKYEATARVYLDTKTVLRPLMRDLAVDLDIDQTVSLLFRTLITRPNVEQLIKKSNFDLAGKGQGEIDQMVDSLMQEIKVMSAGRDNVYSFSYRNTDRERAKLLVQNLVALFVESDVGSKQRDTEKARAFIDEQLKAYEARLQEAEGKLKAFKLRNLGTLDGQGNRDYFSRVSALTEELSKLGGELHASEQSRDALKRELGGETVNLVPDIPAAVIATPELDARLDAQRKQLDEHLRRYTDIHPDVVAARRLIARLEEQKQAEIEAKQRAAAARPAAAAAADPMMQRVRLALAEAEANVAATRSRVREAESKLHQLRATASRVPAIEAELAQLNRDYDVVRRNYDALVAQREKANISEDVDATRPAQFRVIDPPRASNKPVFPNRLVLAPVVLLFALFGGVAAAYVASQVRPVFGSSQALRLMTGRPVLGAISMIKTIDLVRRDRYRSLAFGSALTGMLAVFGGWMTWLAVLSHA
jgi:polysaccharide chain length determinant protein (PEP-CTERM system associated)